VQGTANAAFAVLAQGAIDGGKLHPIKYYREKQLETEVICEHCTLRYAIYGVFAFCPDCREHTRQILEKNLDLCLKQVELAEQLSDPALAAQLILNVLEDAVSAFDGYGRELYRVYADSIGPSSKAKQLSFQNLPVARDNIKTNWGFDFSANVTPDEWLFACLDATGLLNASITPNMGVSTGFFQSLIYR
jgi:hypothetical protein